MYVENKQTGEKFSVGVEKVGSKDFSIIKRSKKMILIGINNKKKTYTSFVWMGQVKF